MLGHFTIVSRVVPVEEALSRPEQVMSIGQPSKFSEQENQLNIDTLDMKSLWLKLKISRRSGRPAMNVTIESAEHALRQAS